MNRKCLFDSTKAPHAQLQERQSGMTTPTKARQIPTHSKQSQAQTCGQTLATACRQPNPHAAAMAANSKTLILMNIKIESAGVLCLLDKNYDSIYKTLKDKYGDGPEQLFTERLPGHQYLQWQLPGSDWCSLADEKDIIVKEEVKRNLAERQRTVKGQFASKELANKILTVPDDEYVFYRIDDKGSMLIRLTAWGYKYPAKIDNGGLSGLRDNSEKQMMTVSFSHDGKYLPNKTFTLNRMERKTDGTGRYVLGELPVGYQFDIAVDDKKEHVTVQKGVDNINIDLTKYATIYIEATLDGTPYNGAEATVNYTKSLHLTTDGNGKASARLPIDLTGAPCRVSMGKESQQRVLTEGDNNLFAFALESKKPQEPVTPEEPEKPITPKPETHEEPEKPITPKTPVTEPPLDDTDNGDEEPEPPTLLTKRIEISVTKDGKPYHNAEVRVEYHDQMLNVKTNEKGKAAIILTTEECNDPCSVTIDGVQQKKVLEKDLTEYVFEFTTQPTVTEQKAMPWWMYLLEALALLLIALLVYLTYNLCYGTLFG